mmetsp:Transcript_40273/g.59742  ORF Transcript_40273/g.59742 Transcript_40273/m.59742 type:complete len:254 (-) Transcript_40273:516-1277(-)
MQFNVLILAALVAGAVGFTSPSPPKPTSSVASASGFATRGSTAPASFAHRHHDTSLNAYRQAYQYQLDLMTAGEIETQILDIDKEIAAARADEESANTNVDQLEEQLAALQVSHELAMSKLKEDMEEYKHREDDYVGKVQALSVQLDAERENASTAKELSNGLTVTRVELEGDLVEMKRKYEAEKWRREFDQTQAQEQIHDLEEKVLLEHSEAEQLKQDALKLKKEIAALKEERKDPLALFKQGFKAMLTPED